jgi:predicted dehydrogenase
MRVGIVGTQWGLMQVDAFRRAGAQVVALCGRDAEKTRRIAEQQGIGLATNDFGRLCEVAEVVVVASPDEWHARHCTQAIDAGRHVMCEKPLTFYAEEAEALARKASAAKGVCAVNFPYRQLEPLKALAKWVRQRGPVRHLEAVIRNAFLGGDMSRSGDLGGASHPIDAALWLMGDGAVTATATGGRQGLALSLGLPSGSAHLVHRVTIEPGIHGHWALAGDGWEAGFYAGYHPEAGGWRISPPRVFEEGRWRDLAPGDEPRDGEPEPWARAHVRTAEVFLAAVRGEPAFELVGFEQGARVQQVLETARRMSAG